MKSSGIARAFTLIELLIVVAIIAILAAIAVPNFLEAQTRAKVSRAKADMRSLSVGLESYRVDSSEYPPDRSYWQTEKNISGDVALNRLTTPIAYVTAVPNNIFPNRTDNPTTNPQYRYFSEYWKSIILAAQGGNPLYQQGGVFEWSLASSGPNQISNLGEYLIFGHDTFEAKFPSPIFGGLAGPTVLYDPTNGTVSDGDIVLTGPGGGFN